MTCVEVGQHCILVFLLSLIPRKSKSDFKKISHVMSVKDVLHRRENAKSSKKEDREKEEEETTQLGNILWPTSNSTSQPSRNATLLGQLGERIHIRPNSKHNSSTPRQSSQALPLLPQYHSRHISHIIMLATIIIRLSSRRRRRRFERSGWLEFDLTTLLC